MAFGHSKSLQLGWAAPKSCWHPGLLGRHLENVPESLKTGINERIDEGGGHIMATISLTPRGKPNRLQLVKKYQFGFMDCNKRASVKQEVMLGETVCGREWKGSPWEALQYLLNFSGNLRNKIYQKIGALTGIFYFRAGHTWLIVQKSNVIFLQPFND